MEVKKPVGARKTRGTRLIIHDNSFYNLPETHISNNRRQLVEKRGNGQKQRVSAAIKCTNINNNAKKYYGENAVKTGGKT